MGDFMKKLIISTLLIVVTQQTIADKGTYKPTPTASSESQINAAFQANEQAVQESFKRIEDLLITVRMIDGKIDDLITNNKILSACISLDLLESEKATLKNQELQPKEKETLAAYESTIEKYKELLKQKSILCKK